MRGRTTIDTPSELEQEGRQVEEQTAEDTDQADGDQADGDQTDGGQTAGESASYSDPVFTKVKASTTLEEDTGKYAPEQLLDGNRQTCWAEGAGTDKEEAWEQGSLSESEAEEAAGIGEWVELSASDEQHVQGLTIVNGYSKEKSADWEDRSNGDTFYYDNPRVKRMTVTFSDGFEETVNLEDAGPGVEQTVAFDEAHDTTSVRLTILEVYDTGIGGSGRCKWPDTSIDEVEVF